MSELSRSKLQVAQLSEAADTATSQGQTELREAERTASTLKYDLHVMSRESVHAAKLCRQSVKELALLHYAMDATLKGMDEQNGVVVMAEALEREAPPPQTPMVSGGGGTSTSRSRSRRRAWVG